MTFRHTRLFLHLNNTVIRRNAKNTSPLQAGSISLVIPHNAGRAFYLLVRNETSKREIKHIITSKY